MIKAGKLVSVVFLFILFFSFELAGQEKIKVTSDSSYVLIQNNTIVIADNDYTSELPFAILFPMFSKKRVFSTDLDQINLIGKIKKPEDTEQFFLNGQNISFSEEGLFFKVLDVDPGKNVLRFKIIPKKGRSVIVNFFIQRTEE